MLMARATILRCREGAASELRIRATDRWLQSSRGSRCVVRTLYTVAPSSLSLPAGSQASEEAGHSGGGNDSHHDQSTACDGREAARLFSYQWHDDGRDRCACAVGLSCTNAAPWMRAIGAAMRLDSTSFLIAWGPAS